MAEEEQSNGASDAVTRALMRRHLTLARKVKEAKDAEKAHMNKIKTFGFSPANWKAVVKTSLSPDDGDAFAAKLREQVKIAKYLGLPIGHQLDILDIDDAKQKIEDEIGEKAYRLGARAHLDNESEKSNPHAANTVEGQEWLRGWRYSAELCGEGEKEIAAAVDGEQ